MRASRLLLATCTLALGLIIALITPAGASPRSTSTDQPAFQVEKVSPAELAKRRADLLAQGFSPPPPPPGTNAQTDDAWRGPYRIVNQARPARDICLDADTNTMGRNGTKVQTWTCLSPKPAQQLWWFWTVEPGDIMFIASAHSPNRYLDADLNMSGPGVRVQLWDPIGANNQRWQLEGSFYHRWSSRHFNMVLDAPVQCLNVNGCSTQLWPNLGNINQYWFQE